MSNLPLLLKTLEARGLPHLVFINKIDTLAGSFRDAIAALQAHSTRPLVPRQLPIRAGDAVIGYIDVVTERAYRYGEKQSVEPIELPPHMREPEKQALTGLTEALADQDDALMEKLLEDVTPTPDELYQHLRKDQAKGSIVEVLIGSASRGHGVWRLWKALRHDVPEASETAERRGVPAGDQPAVQIFKTVQAGKLCYGRIWRGALRDGATLDSIRIGGIYRFDGTESVRATEADAGELVALGRLDGVATGAFLGAAAPEPFPEPPPPVYELAIATKDRKDDVKLSAALQKLVQDDPSMTVEQRLETGETVLQRQGEIHLNTAIERLSSVYNIRSRRARRKSPIRRRSGGPSRSMDGSSARPEGTANSPT